MLVNDDAVNEKQTLKPCNKAILLPIIRLGEGGGPDLYLQYFLYIAPLLKVGHFRASDLLYMDTYMYTVYVRDYQGTFFF